MATRATAHDYAVGAGEKKVVYDVVFKLEKNNAIYFDNGFFQKTDPTQPTANEIEVQNNKQFDHSLYLSGQTDVGGFNVRERLVLPKSSLKNTQIHRHEAGHGLGMRHNEYAPSAITAPPPAVMNTTVEDGGDMLMNNNIRDVLGGAGIGENKNVLQSSEHEELGNAIKITQEGEAPEGFMDGKVQGNPAPPQSTDKK